MDFLVRFHGFQDANVLSGFHVGDIGVAYRAKRPKHNATAAQVILAWAMGEGYAVIPSSTKRENLASNLLARDLQLDDEDKNAIAALECNDRLVSPEGLAPDWD